MMAGLALFMIMVMGMAVMVVMALLAVVVIVPGMAGLRLGRMRFLPAPEDRHELRPEQPSPDDRKA